MADLTIAIATLNDHEGLWWTLQILNDFHGDFLPRCQLVIVDQDPDSEHGRENANLAIRKLKRQIGKGTLWESVKYQPFRAPRGIGPARNRLFAESDSPAVLVMDSHVSLQPGALEKLLEFYEETLSDNLLVGPLVSDEGNFVWTHQEDGGDGHWQWARDEDLADAAAAPKEIQTQGLGLFSCRKEAYPGFHAAQQGFGCAESLFCEKFRSRGDHVICLPWLRWKHRFVRIGGAPYEVEKVDVFSNYLLELISAGIDHEEQQSKFESQLGESEIEELRERIKHASEEG